MTFFGLRAEFLRGLAANNSESERIVDSVISQARELNGGDLDDDLAVLAISCHALPAS